MFCASPLSKHSDALYSTSKKILGDKLTHALVKATFFKHFCAGEDQPEVYRTMKRLQSRGIGGILDFAAEGDDVQPSAPTAPPATPTTASANPKQPVAPGQLGQAVARQYSYVDEDTCDKHVTIFLSAIDTAATMPMQGFAAVKMTGLGNTRLLKRISDAVTEVRGLFREFDTDGSGYVDREEFTRSYRAMLPDAGDEEQARAFEWADLTQTGRIDYVAWCQRMSLTKMPQLADRIRLSAAAAGAGPAWRQQLSEVALTDEEVELVRAMRTRLRTLAQQSADKGVKMMVDAEHTYFQPAIDHLTLELMRKYNTRGAVIYNTYQAYLKDSYTRLKDDLERAKRGGYKLGAKLVRGAYMELERARAQRKGYPSPIHDTLQDTHASYDACAQLLLEEVAAGRAEVLLGSHNQGSIEKATQHMARLGLEPGASPVFFGQLLGMADHLTQVLGSSGYRAFKYVPYGPVHLVIPYLLRRAAENSTIMQGTKRDVHLLRAELARRLRAGQLLS